MLEVTVPLQVVLEVRPDHARVGDHVVLTPTGPDADRSVSGVASMLQQERDGHWADLFYLVSWGKSAPTWIPADEPARFHKVGLFGPVTAVVPPVEPGKYRIRRYFGVPQEDERTVPTPSYADLYVDP